MSEAWRMRGEVVFHRAVHKVSRHTADSRLCKETTELSTVTAVLLLPLLPTVPNELPAQPALTLPLRHPSVQHKITFYMRS